MESIDAEVAPDGILPPAMRELVEKVLPPIDDKDGGRATADQGAQDARFADGVRHSFVRPCLWCGKTVHVRGGVERSHKHHELDEDATRAAYAWWQGHDAARAAVDAEVAAAASEAQAQADSLGDALAREVAEVERLREQVKTLQYDLILGPAATTGEACPTCYLLRGQVWGPCPNPWHRAAEAWDRPAPVSSGEAAS